MTCHSVLALAAAIAGAPDTDLIKQEPLIARSVFRAIVLMAAVPVIAGLAIATQLPLA